MYPKHQMELPPWLQEIMAHVQELHSKADVQQNILTCTAEVQAQGVRISSFEHVANEHTNKHEQTNEHVKVLETQLMEMLAKLAEFGVEQRGRSRSPARTDWEPDLLLPGRQRVPSRGIEMPFQEFPPTLRTLMLL